MFQDSSTIHCLVHQSSDLRFYVPTLTSILLRTRRLLLYIPDYRLVGSSSLMIINLRRLGPQLWPFVERKASRHRCGDLHAISSHRSRRLTAWRSGGKVQSQDDPAQRWWRRPRTRAWDRKKGTGGAREVGERGGAEGDTGTVFTVGFRVLGPGQGMHANQPLCRLTTASYSSIAPALLRSCAPALLRSCAPALLHSCAPALLHSCAPALLHSCTPALHHSITPSLHHSITPSLHHSITPSLHHSITPSLDHSITRSLDHSITRSLDHSITRSLHSYIAP
jgi:hypothetical protein